MSSFLALFVEVNLGFQKLNKKFERECGLSIVQWRCLSHVVRRPAASAQTIADSLGVHPSTLTQSLKRLRKRGQILVETDPADSRKKIISITREGNRALRDFEGRTQALFERNGPEKDALKAIQAFLGRFPTDLRA